MDMRQPYAVCMGMLEKSPWPSIKKESVSVDDMMWEGFNVPPFVVQRSYEWAISEQASLLMTSPCEFGAGCAATPDDRASGMRKSIMNIAVEPWVGVGAGARVDPTEKPVEDVVCRPNVRGELQYTHKLASCTNTHSSCEHRPEVGRSCCWSGLCSLSRSTASALPLLLFPFLSSHNTHQHSSTTTSSIA